MIVRRTMKKLSAHFPPEHPFYFKQVTTIDDPSAVAKTTTTTTTTTGGQTPMADFGLTTPAWNLSSRTPGRDIFGGWTPIPSSSTSSVTLPPPLSPVPSPLEHPLLDPRLVGKTVRAAIVGGEHRKKQAPVAIVHNSDKVALRQSWHQVSHFVEPKWVEVKSPNPTRDNGLLIVIKGEHCGKYVRRIHHRYENDDRQSPIMQLAVVDREETGANVLTGEEIELMPEYLVQGFETDDEKQLNANLMTARRSQARHGS
jgi:hypothetical protein